MRFAAIVFALAVGWSAVSASAKDGDRPRKDLRGHAGPVRQLRFQADGKLLASTANEGSIFLWNVETGLVVRKVRPIGRDADSAKFMQTPQRRVEALSFSPKGTLLADAAEEGQGRDVVRLWDASSGNAVRTLADEVRNARAVAFSPDGRLVAVTMRDPSATSQKIVLYDADSGDVAGELSGDGLVATALAFTPDSRTLVGAGLMTLRAWDVESRKLRHEIKAHEKAIRAMCLSPDGAYAVTAADDDHVRLWKLEDGSRVADIEAEQDGVNDVAFSVSGKTLVSAGDDHTIKLWEPMSGQPLKTLWAHLDRVLCLAFNPDGTLLASGSADKTIALWDFKDPKPDPKWKPPKQDKDKKDKNKKKGEKDDGE
ncbi:MAG: WD40 repeat domain-containing protein [Phycisphaerae bacterium]|jgi:WD40 repeat protein